MEIAEGRERWRGTGQESWGEVVWGSSRGGGCRVGVVPSLSGLSEAASLWVLDDRNHVWVKAI